MAENNNLGELLPIRETNGQRAVNARDLKESMNKSTIIPCLKAGEFSLNY